MQKSSKLELKIFYVSSLPSSLFDSIFPSQRIWIWRPYLQSNNISFLTCSLAKPKARYAKFYCRLCATLCVHVYQETDKYFIKIKYAFQVLRPMPMFESIRFIWARICLTESTWMREKRASIGKYFFSIATQYRNLSCSLNLNSTIAYFTFQFVYCYVPNTFFPLLQTVPRPWWDDEKKIPFDVIHKCMWEGTFMTVVASASHKMWFGTSQSIGYLFKFSGKFMVLLI